MYQYPFCLCLVYREHSAGGPAGAVAAGAGAHAARVPQRSQGSAERPEGDLPGQRGAPPSGTATVQAAQ